MDLTNIVPGRDLDHVHGNEYAGFDADKIREVSFAKLAAYVGKGEVIGRDVARQVMAEADRRRDRYVPARAIRIDARDKRLTFGLELADRREEGAPIVQHALDQVAERVGMNSRYLHDLQARGEPWAAELAARNLNTLLDRVPDDGEKFLVRQVDQTVRGVLSSAFKRIDGRPTLVAMLDEGAKVGAKLVGGTYTDAKVAFKMVAAKPVEVFPNEWMVFGIDFRTGDYGGTAAEFMAFLLRLRCLNGAVSVRELRKIHVGKRFDGDEAASERTLKLGAMEMASWARDQVRALLSPAAEENLVKQIRRANAVEVSAERIEGFLKTRVNKTEAKQIVEKFSSADVVELPPGQTAWRFSNALSWLARDTEDGARKLELEALAGEAMAIG